MKQIIKSAAYILIICAVSFAPCKKELNETSLLPNKKWPVANAGPDQVITLPIESISLNGTGSKDTDSTTSSFLWTKISDTDSFSINIVTARGVKNHVLLYPVCRFNMRRLILSELSDIFYNLLKFEL